MALLPLAAATGFIAMGVGTRWALPAAFIHGATGLGLVVLSPWKQVIVRRGWQRGPSARLSSTFLTILSIAAVASGAAHAAGASTIGPMTIMQVHVTSGLGALAAGIVHYRRHALRPRTTDFGRRSLLLGASTAAAAGLTWLAWEGVLDAAGWRGSERRFTGSHEVASGSPDHMPVTAWFNDRVPEVDSNTWTVTIAGRAWSVAELTGLPQHSVRTTLDCTGGWYSTQDWVGVPLSDLLPEGDWRSVVVTSSTRYRRRLPRRDAEDALLALAVGDQPLTPGHGAPARLVVPGRRGFWWVKWVTTVEVSSRPWWAQLPFPVT